MFYRPNNGSINTYAKKPKPKPAIQGGYIPQNTLSPSPASSLAARLGSKKKPITDDDDDLIPSKSAPPPVSFEERPPPERANRVRKRRDPGPNTHINQLDQINNFLASNNANPNTNRLAYGRSDSRSSVDNNNNKPRATFDPSESNSAKRRKKEGINNNNPSHNKRTAPEKRSLHVSNFQIGEQTHHEPGMDLEISFPISASVPRIWELKSTKSAMFKCRETDVEGMSYSENAKELLIWLRSRKVKATCGDKTGYPSSVLFKLISPMEYYELKKDITSLGLPIKLSDITDRDLFHHKRLMAADVKRPEFFAKPLPRKNPPPTVSTTKPIEIDEKPPNEGNDDKNQQQLENKGLEGKRLSSLYPKVREGERIIKEQREERHKRKELSGERANNHTDGNQSQDKIPDSPRTPSSNNKKKPTTPKQTTSVDMVGDSSPEISSTSKKILTRAKTGDKDPDKAREESLENLKLAEQKKRQDHENFPVSFNFKFNDKKTVTISTDDYKRLDEGEFLNDTMVNFYLKFLQQRAGLSKSEVEKHTYVFNTFFYEKLMQKNADGSSGFENVKKWTSKIDLFKMRYIIVPINWRMHWYVVIVSNLPNALKYAKKPIQGDDGELESVKDAPVPVPINIKNNNNFSSSPGKKPDDGPIIFVLDSLRNTGPSTAVRALKDFFVAEAWDKKGIILDRDVFRGAYPVVPQQPNYCDCGIYVLHYVNRFLTNPETFVQYMADKSPDSKDKLKKLWKDEELKDKRNLLRNSLLEWRNTQLIERGQSNGSDAGVEKQGGSLLNTPSPGGDETANGYMQTANSSRYTTPSETMNINGGVDALSLSEQLEKEHNENSNNNNKDEDDLVILDYQTIESGKDKKKLKTK